MVKVLLCCLSLYATPQDTLPVVDGHAVLQEAQALYTSDDLDAAVQLVAGLDPNDSNYIDGQELLMRALQRQGNASEALAIARLLMEEGENLPAHFYIEAGNVHLAAGKLEEGLTIYQRGLREFPYNHLLMYQVGYGHYKLGQFEQAIGHFQQVAQVRPFFSPAHQMLGNVLSKTQYRTKAVLSYLTYLAIEPNENWALIRLNALLNDALKEEGSVSLQLENDHFEAYDNLLRSRAALDSRYQSAISFLVPAAQQNELLINKLEYLEGTGDFWMNFYVPYLVKIAEEGLTKDFIYFMLYSSGNEEVMKQLEKNEGEKDAWIKITNAELWRNKLQNERTILDSTGIFSHWYTEDGDVKAIGQETALGLKVGPFEYYHDNGRLSARGRYDSLGQKEGLWRYYHDNGTLQSVKQYNDHGEVVGTVWHADENDRLVSKGTYVDGKMDGTYRSYYPSGRVKEEVPYTWGLKHGVERRYFRSGQLMEEVQWVDNEKLGWQRRYAEDGSLELERFHESSEVGRG
ncbi:MAG: hypothetical protein AAGA85_15880 [Bacteroidota bacterium]